MRLRHGKLDVVAEHPGLQSWWIDVVRIAPAASAGFSEIAGLLAGRLEGDSLVARLTTMT